uniref:Putative secreted protein n=1 Tax=Ixodes ricinus TaxID=34613 RepID=A0A6B0U9K0_IXORI
MFLSNRIFFLLLSTIFSVVTRRSTIIHWCLKSKRQKTCADFWSKINTEKTYPNHHPCHLLGQYVNFQKNSELSPSPRDTLATEQATCFSWRQIAVTTNRTEVTGRP